VVAQRITSPSNPLIKSLARLKNSRERAERGLFLIEGPREIGRAIEAGIDIDTLLICPALGGEPPTGFDPNAVLEVGQDAIARVAIRRHPPGSIAVARQFATGIDRLQVSASPLLLVVEAIEKPGNLGAMMRTADGAAVDAVIVADPNTDVFNPNVVRASQGALFTVPVVVAEAADVIEWLQARSMTVVGGYPDARTELWESDLTEPTAVLVGAEDIGISPAWDDVARKVRIPMRGSSDSLNASVAAAIMLFEAVRQRRSG
jgi:TrmH family RNA methyltransferase